MNLSMGNTFVKIASTLFIAVVILPGCASNPDSRSVQDSKQVNETQAGQVQETLEQVKETQSGQASFISDALQGRKTASGETFDKNELVAAHASYPIGTVMRVTNLENERVVEVRINDRASTANHKEGTIVDLSPAAAKKLEFVKDGKARVRTEVLEWGGKHND
jgi:rare lipoprotein A